MISLFYMLKRFTQIALLCSITVSVPLHSATIADYIVPRGYVFSRDIPKGSTISPDVLYLQNILNMSTSTRVSETGAGSNNQLTAYYGPRTQAALAHFQALFRVDIDFERQLATTSGMTYVVNSEKVDIYTRRVLNKLAAIYSDDRDYYRANGTSSGIFSTSTERTITLAPGTNDVQDEDDSETPSVNDSPETFIYKNEKIMFKYSPQGMLLQAIGGDELVDKVFSYTPAGQIGKQLGLGGAGGAGGLGSSFGGGSFGGAGGAAVQNFGGRITSMTSCTCSFNLLLYVQDVRGQTLPLMYQPGATVLYKMYQPTTGVNVLGQYTSGGQCLIYAGTSCSSGGSPIGTMIQLGTSSI